MDKQPIVFAFYRNGRLVGYRQDTIGSIGMEYPKIYSAYSKEQVETVLKNIEHNVKNPSGFGKALGIDVIAEREEEIHQFHQDNRAFEVRVLKSPGYPVEREFDVTKAEWVENIVWSYPTEEINKWLETPEEHEVIETHYFSLVGRMNLQ